MKVGQTIWECDIDEPTGKISFDQWIIRTIRGGKVYAILKTSYTWGKRSKKHGDFGWLDPIPSFCRRSIKIGEDWPSWQTMATTKKASVKRAIRLMDSACNDDFSGITVDEIVKKLKTLYKRV